MKFYISSRVKDKNKVQQIKNILNDKGHEVTFDWTQLGGLKPYGENQEESEKHVKKFEESIRDADVFVLITDAQGTGMYTELGIALMENRYSNAPDIYVIGNHLSRSIFYFHPLVKRRNKFDDVLEDLGV